VLRPFAGVADANTGNCGDGNTGDDYKGGNTTLGKVAKDAAQKILHGYGVIRPGSRVQEIFLEFAGCVMDEGNALSFFRLKEGSST
jgi:hypothetical protein